jgi:hypothetical protein
MSLWGASTTDESKPKHLTDAEKRDVYATKEGWVKRTAGTGGRAGRVHEEILVAIGDLSGGTAGTAKLAAGTISSTRFITTSLGAAAGGAFSAEVIYNEKVDVTGTPLLTVTNETDAARNVVCEYASGTGTNRLTFTATVAADATTVGDVLSVGADAVTAAGTIKDAGTNTDSARTHSAQAATTNITVAA